MIVTELGPVHASDAHGPGPARSQCATEAAVVDTTGAGDAFNAAYLDARLTGETQADAAAAGHKLASKVIGSAGAILPMNPPE